MLLGVLVLVQLWGLYAPSPPVSGPSGTDKLAHLLGFGAPAAVAWWLGARRLVGLMVGHALVSEPLQHLVSADRTTDWCDGVADLVGIALGVALAGAVLRVSRHHGGMQSAEEA